MEDQCKGGYILVPGKKYSKILVLSPRQPQGFSQIYIYFLCFRVLLRIKFGFA